MIYNNLPDKLNDYNPLENKILKIVDIDGGIVNDSLFPDLDDEQIKEAYRKMLYERVADELAISYQRQGRMYTYTPNLGQEAIHVAAGMNISHDDWLVPSFREMGTLLSKGVTMKDMFLFYLGSERGGCFANAHNTLPIAISIASQLHHAVGIGYSLKYMNLDDVVFTFVGDGGTSEGDFSESLNFAALWEAPVVFTIQNNQYAISVPVSKQTKAINLAVKGIGFGVPSIKVDGNDFFAMYMAYQTAREHCASGKGPMLIEAYTYRMGAHTTSDDPSKYRDKQEEVRWADYDPMIRLEKYMSATDIWDIDKEMLRVEYKEEINRLFMEAEEGKSYPLDDVFDYMYSDKPAELVRQKEEYEEFLKWKEVQR